MPSKQSRNVKVQSRPVSSSVSDEQTKFYQLDYEVNRAEFTSGRLYVFVNGLLIWPSNVTVGQTSMGDSYIDVTYNE